MMRPAMSKVLPLGQCLDLRYIGRVVREQMTIPGRKRCCRAVRNPAARRLQSSAVRPLASALSTVVGPRQMVADKASSRRRAPRGDLNRG
jgi:hypothetical protein